MWALLWVAVARSLCLPWSVVAELLVVASSTFATSSTCVSTELVEDVLALDVTLSVRVRVALIVGGWESSPSSFSLTTLVASNAGKVVDCFVGVVPVGASSWNAQDK